MLRCCHRTNTSPLTCHVSAARPTPSSCLFPATVKLRVRRGGIPGTWFVSLTVAACSAFGLGCNSAGRPPWRGWAYLGTMCISAILIINRKGEIVISRFYRRVCALPNAILFRAKYTRAGLRIYPVTLARGFTPRLRSKPDEIGDKTPINRKTPVLQLCWTHSWVVTVRGFGTGNG